MAAHQACLDVTSKDDSPSYVVPAEDRNNTRLIMSQIMSQIAPATSAFELLNLQHPIDSPSAHKGTEGATRQADAVAAATSLGIGKSAPLRTVRCVEDSPAKLRFFTQPIGYANTRTKARENRKLRVR